MEGYQFLEQLASSVSGMFPRLSKLSALLVPALGVIQAAPTATTCSDLMNTLKLDRSVKLILSSPYPDNTTFQDPYSQAYNAPAPYLPSFCRVYANISTSSTSATLFEVWMPLETWNGRFLTVGNGGGAGGVNYPALGQGLRAGYATCSTDAGHNSSVLDGSWQSLGEQVAIDFGW
jgi:feruloyl esterase